MAVAVLVLVAAGARLQTGHAAPSSKYYSTTFGPTFDSQTVAAGTTIPVKITLTNSTTSQQTLGSENVTLPLGYTAPAGEAVMVSNASKHWLAVSIGQTTLADGTHTAIQLRAASSGDALAPSESAQTTVTVTVPCNPPSGTQTWYTEAKQSNSFNGPPGNDFLSTTGTQSSTGVYSYIGYALSGGGCGFEFVDPSSGSGPWVPTSQHAGHSFPVEIQAVDGNGNPRTGYSGPATMSGLADAPNGVDTPTYGASDDGTHQITFDSLTGLASFDVTAVAAQASTALTVTDNADSTMTGTSDPFQVFPGDPAALAFDQQPTDTAVTTAPTSYPIDPAVTVDVYDAYGNQECAAPDCTQASVGLAISNDAGEPDTGSPTTLGGAGPVTSSAGVATFSNVTLDQSGSGFTLVACSPDCGSPTFSSSGSDPFNVWDSMCNQKTDPNGYTTCTASKKGTSITTDYPTSTTDPTTFLLTSTTNLACGTSPGDIGEFVKFTPAGGYTLRTGLFTVTFVWDKTLVPGTGVSNFTLCLQKPGATGYWSTPQVVQNCPNKITNSTTLPCASSRHRDNAGDLVITLKMGSNDPVAHLGGG